ncbi:hypothetical protein ACA910_001660 [Epithemia clementina (nom. ined.)]
MTVFRASNGQSHVQTNRTKTDKLTSPIRTGHGRPRVKVDGFIQISPILLVFFAATLSTPVAALNQEDVWEHLENTNAAYTLLFPWVTECIGVCLFFLLTRYEIPVPYPALLFLIGTLLGWGAVSRAAKVDQANELDQWSTSVLQWSNIQSSVLLLVFLPGLIFRDALEVNFNLFMAALPQILVLAFPMVLVGTMLTAVVGFWIVPGEWSWSLAATLGAILASTDPIAVGSVLKKAGSPARLQMHISGESLLNDGSAVVFFSIFSQQFLSELGYADPVDVGQGFATFFRMSFGGFAVGIAFAAGLLILLYELDRRLEPEYNVLQVAVSLTFAYLSYYVSEQVCAMSGVIACVVCGIVVRALGRGLINDNKMMDSYLGLMEYLLNTLLFTLGGVVWGKVIASGDGSHIDLTDAGYLIAVYLLVMLIRFVQMALFYPIFSQIGLKSDWKETTFLAYGGLRGAVGVALALSLNRSVREVTENVETLQKIELLEFLAGGVTLLTLFVNGTTAGPVLRLLGLAKPVTSRKRALRLFRFSAEAFVKKAYESLVLQPRFAKTKHSIVKMHVPFVTSEPQQRYDGPAPVARSVSFRDEIAPAHRLLEATDRGCPNEIVMELRQIFVELLNEAYNKELSNGELDEREDNGYNFDILRQSVVFTATDVDHLERIHDWDYTENFRYQEDAKSFLIRKMLELTGRSTADHNCGYEYQKQRILVLRSLAFIEAHRQADEKLIRYTKALAMSSLEDGEIITLVTTGTETVLSESEAQVKKAKQILEGIRDTEVNNIVSRYLCTILLHKLAKFVEQNAENGILTKKEAKGFLDKIDRNIQETHTCTAGAGGTSLSLRVTDL